MGFDVAGREKIATYERVAAEAERLVLGGTDPAAVSYRQVALAIGGGSATTITSALRRWRADKGIEEPKRRGRPAAAVRVSAGAEQRLKSFLEQKLEKLLAKKAALQGEMESLDAQIAQARGAIEVGVAELKAVMDKYSLSPADLGEVLAALQREKR